MKIDDFTKYAGLPPISGSAEIGSGEVMPVDLSGSEFPYPELFPIPDPEESGGKKKQRQ